MEKSCSALALVAISLTFNAATIGAGETLVFVGRPWQATIGDYINFTLVVRQ